MAEMYRYNILLDSLHKQVVRLENDLQLEKNRLNEVRQKLNEFRDQAMLKYDKMPPFHLTFSDDSLRLNVTLVEGGDILFYITYFKDDKYNLTQWKRDGKTFTYEPIASNYILQIIEKNCTQIRKRNLHDYQKL